MTSLSDLYEFYCRRCGCKANSRLCHQLKEVYEANGGKREADKIDISQNYLGPKGVEPVCLLAKNLYTLTELDFRHNSMQHDECEMAVIALTAHPSLQKLNLSFNKLHDASTPLLEHLVKSTPTLVEVLVDGNDFSPAHLSKLEAALNVNREAQIVAAAEAEATGEAAASRGPRYLPYKSEVSGVLTKETSGGHFHYASWRKNPQYALYLSRAATATITLKVHDPQPTRQLGFVVLKSESLLKRIDFEPDDIIAESTFNEKSTFVQVQLEAADRSQAAAPYVVVPFAFNPGRTAEFQLVAEVDPSVAPDGTLITIEEIDPQREWCCHEVTGDWADDNGAGDLSHPSWRQNDFYRIKYNGPVSRGVAKLFFLLTKANDSDDNDEREIGFYLLRPDTKGRAPVRITTDTVLASTPHARQTSVKLHYEVACASIDFFLVPTTSQPKMKGDYTLQCFSTCNLEVYQSTFPHEWFFRELGGEWDDQRDGGSRMDNPTTWIHNPSYELTVEPKPGESNFTVDVHFQLERGTSYEESVAAGIEDSIALRKYKEQTTEDIGLMMTTTDGELSVVSWTQSWSHNATNELWVNELPPGSYYVIPFSRRAGHRDTYHLELRSSSAVSLSFDIPLARRLREKQLQRYAEENEARRQESATAALAWGSTAALGTTTANQNASKLHPYDEDYDEAAKIRDAITEAYMSNGNMFIDRDFPRAASSLWLDPDLPPKETPANVVNWLRPSAIKLRPGSVDPTNVVEPMFTEGADGVIGCEIGGGFNTEWFHGAVGAIATRGDWLAKIVGAHFPEYGFVQFRFFKNGRWQTVTIDDYLPVDPFYELCFSRGVDPIDIFVPLVEKAWAKLHRCYEALDSGPEAISEALTSLTGGVCQTQELQTEDGREWAHKSLWDIIKLCREKNQLVSLCLQRGSPAVGDKQYVGLHLDSLYAIVDSRDVEGKKLVKLNNYWGPSKPWKGKWAHNSENWTPTLKKAVDYHPQPNAFWIALDEVKYYFSHLYHVTLQASSAVAYTTFAPSQPSGDLQRATWVNNPQYALKAHSSGKLKVTIGLHQPDARMQLTRARGSVPEYPCEMGVVCIRTDDDSRRLMTITTKEMPTTSAITQQRDTTMQIEMNCGAGEKYILMPFTLTPKACSCYLSVCCASPVPLSLKLIDTDRNVSLDGEWKGVSAGGPRTFGSWRNNPQYLLYPSESTQITVVLKQRNEFDSTAARIGFTVLKAHDIRRVLHPNPDDVVLEVPHDNDHAVVGHVHVDGVRERLGMPYIVVPSTSAPHLDTGFSLEVVSNKRVQLKQVEEAYDWKRADVHGNFLYTEGTTGGPMAYSSWRNNPQYALSFPTEKSGNLLIVMTKRDQQDTQNELGLTVMKADGWGRGKMRKVLCPAGDILAQATCAPEESCVEIRLDYQVRNEPLILMPYTVTPLTELEYDISFYCSSDIVVTPVTEWKQHAVEGSWQPGVTAGGSRERNRSWINNPFYCLAVSRPTRVVVVALQYPKGPEKPIARRVGKNRAFLPPPIVNETNKVCFGFDVCHFDAMNTNIHSTRHTYDGEVSAMLEMPPCERNPFLVVPHTFDPEQEADFKLLVYADEPFELYRHEKARRFY